jgi:Glycosyltransferase like family
MTPTTHVLPSAEEVEPWVQTIICLWDDPALYEEQSIKAKAEAQRWHPDLLRPLYAKFFNEVTGQTRSPVIPRKERGNGVVNSAPRAMANGKSTRCPAERPQGAMTPLNARPGVVPLSFVVCVSDEETLKANFMASPCVADADAPHQIILLHEVPDAACGLSFGRERASHDWAVCVHQDVYLPKRWDQRLIHQLCEAERRFGTIGVAGVYGVGEVIAPHDRAQPLAAERIGWAVDHGRDLRDGPELPAAVAMLNELLLVVRRDSGLEFDPATGFHLYGADICLQARERGLAVVALGALCHHNSRSVGLPEAFFRSAEVFARKWSHRLPVATPCVIIGRGGAVDLPGNASARPESIAYALSRPGPGLDEPRVSRNSVAVLHAGYIV